MAPVQKLGNVDTKKRTSQKVAFGIFTLLSYLVVVILSLFSVLSLSREEK